MNGTAFVKAVERARKICAEKKHTCCVIEIDKEDSREITICEPDYLKDPEFEAFFGELLAQVFIDYDGAVQTHYEGAFA
jgi:hypothetical protein